MRAIERPLAPSVSLRNASLKYDGLKASSTSPAASCASFLSRVTRKSRSPEA